jgi:hypothetical protein
MSEQFKYPAINMIHKISRQLFTQNIQIPVTPIFIFNLLFRVTTINRFKVNSSPSYMYKSLFINNLNCSLSKGKRVLAGDFAYAVALSAGPE